MHRSESKISAFLAFYRINQLSYGLFGLSKVLNIPKLIFQFTGTSYMLIDGLIKAVLAFVWFCRILVFGFS